MNPNLVLSMVLMLLGEYRKARERQRALNPRTGVEDDPATAEREDFLSDAQIIELLRSEAVDLQAHADELLEKFRLDA